MIIAVTCTTFAQGTNPEYYQPRRIVNMPNAGLLPSLTWMSQIRLGEGGGMLGYVGLGLWGRIQVGASYGAHGVLGRGKATAYPRPHLQAKLRPKSETIYWPAIVIGYDDQGLGQWDEERERYAVKSPGIFLVASKNWATFGGNLGLHLGLNYSLEESDQNGFNSYIGLDKNIGTIVAVSVEYDAAINDNDTKDGVYGTGKGYLNAALKLSLSRDIEIEFIAADLLINDESAETFAREIRLTFVHPL